MAVATKRYGNRAIEGDCEEQILVPAEIRGKLGIVPGSILEWDEHAEGVLVRRAGQFSSKDIHEALFAKKRKRKPVKDVKGAIRKHIRRQQARR